MRARSFVLPGLAAVVILCGPLLGYAVGARHKPGDASEHHVYRLDYLVSVREPGRAASTSTYTMNVAENEHGELRVGASVPLSSSSSSAVARLDVGLLLRCHVTRAGEELVLHQTTELSGIDDRVDQGPRPLRKITMNDDALAALGTPAVVASVEEPATRARYEVTVTATKLR